MSKTRIISFADAKLRCSEQSEERDAILTVPGIKNGCILY